MGGNMNLKVKKLKGNSFFLKLLAVLMKILRIIFYSVAH